MADDLDQRHGNRRPRPEGRREGGRLGEADPHVEPDQHQDRADQERQAPTPGEELRLPQDEQEHEEQPVRQEKAERGTELGEHAEPGAPVGRRVFGGEQRRAAPLAAEPDTLSQAQQAEQPGRREPDRGIARKHADQRRGQAHHDQRGDQRRLAADAVAEMAEQHRADRPREERDAEGEERVERLRAGGRRGKEDLPDHERGGRAVDVEVIELDRRADQARQDDAPGPGRPCLGSGRHVDGRHAHGPPALGGLRCPIHPGHVKPSARGALRWFAARTRKGDLEEERAVVVGHVDTPSGRDDEAPGGIEQALRRDPQGFPSGIHRIGEIDNHALDDRRAVIDEKAIAHHHARVAPAGRLKL